MNKVITLIAGVWCVLAATMSNNSWGEQVNPMTPEEQKAWEEHWDGVANAFVGGMSVLAEKGINKVISDVSQAVSEIKAILAEPVFKPDVWQMYSDGKLRLYKNGQWYVQPARFTVYSDGYARTQCNGNWYILQDGKVIRN